MASFKKRGKKWEYKISAKPRPITKCGFNTKKEAQIAATEKENMLNKGILTALKDKPFYDYFVNWVKIYKSKVAGKTKRHYEDTANTIKRYFHLKAIQDITRDQYQLFITEFGETRAKETVDKLHGHIRNCVRDAAADHIIPLDFTRRATITWTVPAKKNEEKHLHYKETIKLQDELWNRLHLGLGYYMVLLGLYSGMRYSELTGLTRNDFDFQNNLINIDKTWVIEKDKEPDFGPTKNHETREIVMIEPVMQVFKELFESTPTNMKQLVFYSAQSKYQVISNNNVNKVLRRVLNDLGIDTITSHGLRHTHASYLIYEKVSLDYVSERLGHIDIDTTRKTYVHVLKEMRNEEEENTLRVLDSLSNATKNNLPRRKVG
ncbi:tyrosine-type recombinase/integrase [Oceanobacillus oncorhynchi]|uniref:tyrosine-type recombinase/integrase n=1 Tax=Oceanobacillus oncorhynchi TaxID=545501 RepID=UPI001868781A|nr:site-specific integrase [Oceanobacillus oncorhynchi]